MKAVIRRGPRLLESEIADVTPNAGQALVRTLACGICGSDLHAVHQLDALAAASERSGAANRLDPEADLVLGHEFCAEILDYGPGTERRFKTGTRVVSTPFAMGPNGPELIGFSARYPGGFATKMVLTEALMLAVPNGLSAEHAALVEPLAVGSHAVGVANLSERPVILVIGCGPVGLAVIIALKARGAGPIVACDYLPARRRLAEIMGADIVIDPAETSPHAHWSSFDVPATLAEMGMARMLGRQFRPAVIFECVGMPGIIQSVIEFGPPKAQIIVAGVCMSEDKITPFIAINKQLRLDFVFAYTSEEFKNTLIDVADGRINVAPLISGTVGRSGVAAAFEAMRRPNETIKIIVDPGRD